MVGIPRKFCIWFLSEVLNELAIMTGEKFSLYKATQFNHSKVTVT